MKNRLQLRHHMPETFPFSREEAVKYIDDKFRAYNRTEADGELLLSLTAEPLLVFYGESRLNSNVILAIGRNADNDPRPEYNMPYFLIDFARLDEDLTALTGKVEGLEEILDQVYADLEVCKADIQVCKEDIEALKRHIGEKGDSPAKDTVFGYIEGAYVAVTEEEHRATNVETALQSGIEANTAKIDNLVVNLEAERDARIEEDDDLAQLIKDEETRAKNVEETLTTTLNDEITRSNAEDLAIRQEIATLKKDKVVSANKTVIVGAPTENGTDIAVNIDYQTLVVNEGGVISVSADALDLKINENDKILTDDVNGLIATLSLKWVHASAEGEKDEIQLIGKNDSIISRIDVADFIKDGMLQSVELTRDEEGNPTALKFVFNVDSDKTEPVLIPIKDLIDIYEAGDGLEQVSNVFSLKLDEAGDGFLTVSSQGLKISGVKEFVGTSVEAEKSRAMLAEQELADRVAVNESSIATLTGNVGTDGSVKSNIYNAVIGATITDIAVEQAGEQSLIKKVVISDTPYFYASNSTADMKHGDEKLDVVIETVKTDVATNKDAITNLEAMLQTVTEQLQTVTEQLQTMTENYNNLLNNYNDLAGRMDALESNPVTITGTPNEIAVTKDPDSATYTIGFAPDAYFVAGEN